MKFSLIPRALVLSGLGSLAASTLASDRPAIPPCSQLEAQVVTLRGTVSRTFDNMSPNADFGDELVLDPMEEVALVTLRHPICVVPDDSSHTRPVVQSSVTVVELVLGDEIVGKDLRSHVGKVRTIEGTLSENVWWHYKATMRISAKIIK